MIMDVTHDEETYHSLSAPSENAPQCQLWLSRNKWGALHTNNCDCHLASQQSQPRFQL